jgi:hypothetical protein
MLVPLNLFSISYAKLQSIFNFTLLKMVTMTKEESLYVNNSKSEKQI